MLTDVETLAPVASHTSMSAAPDRADGRGLMDHDAFVRCVDRHKHKMVNYLTRLTGERERAEDIAQETFVRFYKNRDRYRDEGTLVAYLFRIATNLVRSEERRKKRWRLLEPMFSRGGRSPDGVRTVEHPGQSCPAQDALGHEVEQRVSAAIASLPMHFRAALVLREIEGLSYREVSEVLNLHEGTVKSRLHRAKELLREQLEDFWKGKE